MSAVEKNTKRKEGGVGKSFDILNGVILEDELKSQSRLNHLMRQILFPF